MILRFKVGTLPAQYLKVYRKRKPPKVGDLFYIVTDARIKQYVHLTDIVTINEEQLYFVELI